MADRRIIGKTATLSTRTSSAAPTPTKIGASQLQAEPVSRVSVISREPGIQPATTTVRRAGGIIPSEPPEEAPPGIVGEPVSRQRVAMEDAPLIQRVALGELPTAGIATEVVGEDCEPIAGRARSPTTTGTRLIRVQSIINNAVNLNPTQVAALNTEMVNGASQYLREPRLWSIRTFGEDSMNSAGAGGAFGTWGAVGFPIPRLAQNCAAARAYSGRSWLHVRVRWEGPGTSGTFDMDLGGSPIEIYANHIKLNIIAPANHVEIFEGIGAPALAGAWTLQCLTDAFLEIVPIEASRGNRVTTLTMRQEAAATTQIGFEIPAYAKRVTLYQSIAGAAAPQWTFELGAFGAANASIEIGQLPFIAGARRTDQIDVVPGATFIQSDVDQVNARLFTAVWEIEP